MSRPFIHINCAVGENGLWNNPAKDTAGFSCPVDWRRVHGLREQYDAVAVGGLTWVLDKPRLTARAEHLGREPVRQPVRVVFAGGQYCEPRGSGPLFVVTSNRSAPDAQIIPSGGRDLGKPLHALFDLGIRSILVEGGPTLAGSFLLQECVDRITVFVRTESESTAAGAARLALPGLSTDVSVVRLGEGFLIDNRHGAMAASASGF